MAITTAAICIVLLSSRDSFSTLIAARYPLDVFFRVSFVPHFSQLKLLALIGACCTCWQLMHLTFVVLPVGVGLSVAALGFDVVVLLVTLGRPQSSTAIR